MNKLGLDKQVAVINGLVEGLSIRSVERMTGVHRDTVMRLLVRVGDTCQKIMDEKMRNLNCSHSDIESQPCYGSRNY
jgi:hypothetical protein